MEVVRPKPHRTNTENHISKSEGHDFCHFSNHLYLIYKYWPPSLTFLMHFMWVLPITKGQLSDLCTDDFQLTFLVIFHLESLLSTHDSVYVVDDTVLELSEVEETASESSCFASEDTTEDSGVVSSPSDIVSLDSQNDSVKLRDIRLVNGHVDPGEADAARGAERCPMQSPYCDSAGPDSAPPR